MAKSKEEVNDTQVQEPVQEKTVATESASDDPVGDHLERLSFGEEEPTNEEPEDDFSVPDPDAEEEDWEAEPVEGEEEEQPEGEADPAPEPQTEPSGEEEKTAEEPKAEVEDDFAELREAGYTGAALSTLVSIVQNNPRLQAVLQEELTGQPSQQPQVHAKEETEEKLPQDFMPEGKTYSSVDAMEPGTESFKAHEKYQDWRADQVYLRRTAEQQRAYQTQLAQQRQQELLQRGRENLKSKYGVSDDDLKKFRARLQKIQDVSPLEVAYLGINFENLVEARANQLLEKEVDRRVEEVLRSKNTAKTKSSVGASTGAEKARKNEFEDPVDEIAERLFS